MIRRSKCLALTLAVQSFTPLALSFDSAATTSIAAVRNYHPSVFFMRNNSSVDNDKEVTTMSSDSAHQLFGRFRISSNQIFHRTIHSYALVNLRPIVPGHVLVCSNRVTPLLSNLDEEEYDDLWKTVRIVQQILRQQYNCNAFNVAVQDGVGAGQSVPHVHVHILPRYIGDLERNDDIYDQLEAWAPRDDDRKSGTKTKLDVPEDSERRDRTVEEMTEEAAVYRRIADELSTEDTT